VLQQRALHDPRCCIQLPSVAGDDDPFRRFGPPTPGERNGDTPIVAISGPAWQRAFVIAQQRVSRAGTADRWSRPRDAPARYRLALAFGAERCSAVYSRREIR
jgi:hypothetical protein